MVETGETVLIVTVWLRDPLQRDPVFYFSYCSEQAGSSFWFVLVLF